MKLCECGCGLPAPIAKVTCKRLGHIKGQPVRFLRGHWAKTDAMRGEKHPQWNGGRTIHTGGYVMIQAPGHPRANDHGYVFEHILIAEKALGRFISAPIELPIYQSESNSCGRRAGRSLKERDHEFPQR